MCSQSSTVDPIPPLLYHKVSMQGEPTPLGHSIPSTNHAVSVSLPYWRDNVGYEEGDPRVINAMKGGYPRFVLHPYVKKLMDFCLEKFGNRGEACLLLNSRDAALDCRVFMKKRQMAKIRLVDYIITPDFIKMKNCSISLIDSKAPVLYLILFPMEMRGVAKEYWQHTGSGISSRFAEYCLILLNMHFPLLQIISSATNGESSQYGATRRQSAKKLLIEDTKKIEEKLLNALTLDEADLFVEERFGRNLDQSLIGEAKSRLKERIAGVLGDHFEKDNAQKYQELASGRSITPDNVFLFSCGMAAIYFSHQLVREMYPGLKTVQFGFPYIDTLKIQEKWGAGCIFLGRGDSNDLQLLEKILETERISALYCEFPSNPLLISPPVKQLWELAKKYKFLLIIDETIGNFCNVKLIDHCHMMVSSLTKIFSGDSNVMGGSLVINPACLQSREILQVVKNIYIDAVWGQDAIFLERNSRKFKQRIRIINENAEKLCDAIRNHPKVEQLCYPKYTYRDAYLEFAADLENPGYGGLFSIVLKTKEQAERFYDNLDVYKGPSLGTSFTLVCPYTVLAHYTELSWASSFGVSPWLVRVSVGLEDLEQLLEVFKKALELA